MKNKDFEIADGVLKKYHGNSESVAVPYGVRKIGDEAFKGAASLKKLVMPETVEEIGDFAFEGCTYLKSVVITDVVIAGYKRNFFERLSDKLKEKLNYDNPWYSSRKIGVKAFADCESLLNVDLPVCVNILCEEAFRGCSNLQTIVQHNPDENTDKSTFSKYDSIGKLEIKGYKIRIENRAFMNCSALREISISDDGNLDIGQLAFFKCDDLRSVKITCKSVIKIGKQAFSECEKLKDFEISGMMDNIEDSLFSKCKSLTNIKIPYLSSKANIGERAFEECTSLKNIDFLSGLNTIGNMAFYRCKSITNIDLCCATNIGERAFEECTSLKYVNFLLDVNTIGNMAFYGCKSLTDISVISVKNIGKRAFEECTSLKNIYFEISTIGDRAFYGCRSLTEIGISASDIGERAFEECTSLKNIYFSSGINTIGNRAFYGCKSLTEIFIHGKIMKEGKDVFEGCTSLESFFVNGKFINTGMKIVKEKRKTKNAQKKKTETTSKIKENQVSKTQNKTKNKTQTEVSYHKYTPENKENTQKNANKAVNTYSNKSADKALSSGRKGANMSAKQQKPEKKKMTARVRHYRKEFLTQVERISTGNLIVSQYGDNLMPRLFKGEEYTGASYDEGSGKAVLRVEVMGTGYEGRTPRIETLSAGDCVEIVREPENEYNSNNLAVRNTNGESLGNLSAEIGNCLSPLIDAGAATVTSAKVSLVKTRADRGKRARKADLYVEFDDGGCVVLLLGGDQVNVWAQKLTVLHCDIPIEDVKLLFEAENRLHGQYEDADPDADLSYVGLEGLEKEIIDAREKRKGSMIRGKDYSAPAESATEEDHYIQNFMLKLAKQDPKRYGVLKKYSEDLRRHIGVEKGEEWREYWPADVSDIFREHEIDSRTYYWLDRTRVSTDVYDREATGFYHWYNVMELYESEKDIPFDLNDEDIACIFGFNKFVDFADLSYGC